MSTGEEQTDVLEGDLLTAQSRRSLKGLRGKGDDIGKDWKISKGGSHPLDPDISPVQ